MLDQEIDETEDGKTHIRLAWDGRTALGRCIDNSAVTPFEHPEFGTFKSMDAFRLWLATGQTDRRYRHLYGEDASRLVYRCTAVENPRFLPQFHKAFVLKLQQSRLHGHTLLEHALQNKLEWVIYFIDHYENVVSTPLPQWMTMPIDGHDLSRGSRIRK